VPTTSLSVGVVALLVAAGPANDLDSLQGAWKLSKDHWGIRGDVNGLTGTWTIQGNGMIWAFTTATRGTIRFDSTKDPGRFERNFADTTVKGTYRLEGDTLKIYRPTIATRHAPPVDLPEEPARGYELEIWKRLDKSKGEGVDGDWRRTAYLLAGGRNLISMTGDTKMHIKGDLWESRAEDQRQCSFRIDPTKAPKHLDVTFGGTALRGPHTEPWVYKLEGDRLTVWQPLRTRPTSVSDAADSKDHFWVFDKLKP
jgi:uncharacterized protein (TIGR03067 family)